MKKINDNLKFSPDYDKNKNYCITIPPPNITGDLHMGHAFQCTLMDILVRYYRMIKFSVLWKMGVDHAGIATQLLLEKKFLSTDKLYLFKSAYKWKKISFKKIKSQLSKLDCSLYFKTSRFTLDNHFSYAVKKAFIYLYSEDLIYKAKKIVNWDTSIKSAISDLEIIYTEEYSKLYYIQYKIIGEENYVTVSTSRPETIFADAAVALNIFDKRKLSLINKNVAIPIINKSIPIIFDESVDINFGSGCLKLTPGHDFLDFDLASKHKLDILNILNQDGTLNANVPSKYNGLTVIDARSAVVKDLFNLGLISNVVEYKTKIPRADRSNTIIEPFLTDQWYVKTKPLIEPVLDCIINNKVKILPMRWKNTFIDWSSNIKDWCISRQIWWGHKLPVWYDNNLNIYVGQNEHSVRHLFSLNKNSFIYQDDNVLDTWFSSALWPFASLGWPSKKKEYIKFYPTSTLVTGFDIIFFWVIRMLMFGIKFTGTIPFNEIYIHGLIRDNLGNKMSKTKGNVIDPIDIIDGITYKNLVKKRTQNLISSKHIESIVNNTIKLFPNGIESFGVNSLRLTFASMATDNMFLKLDFKKLDKYKKFCNKILNANRFLLSKSSDVHTLLYKKLCNNIWTIWIFSVWQKIKKNLILCIKTRQFSRFIEFIYNFFWINFCDWYIEASKYLFNSLKYKTITFNCISILFSEILLSIYPVIPNLVDTIFNTNIFLKNKYYLCYPKFNYKFVNFKIEFNIKMLKDVCLKIRHIKTLLKSCFNFVIFVKFLNNKIIKIFEEIKSFICLMSDIEHIFILRDIKYIKGIKIFFTDFLLIIPSFQVENDMVFVINKLKKMRVEKDVLEKKLSNIKFLNNAKPNIIKDKRDKLNNISKSILTFEQFLF
ncbi:MAG TPA: valine--tRNA ligase [Candidatus Azoamicus sp. MARI]